MLALITGGSRGIGRAIAKELASVGYEIVLTAKDEGALRTVSEELKTNHGRAPRFHACDLSNRASIEDLLQKTSGLELDVVVLCAGTFIEGSLENGRIEDFDTTLQVNLVANYQLVQGLIPRMVDAQRPRIIVIGSTAALEPYKLGALYGVSKWALRGFTYNLRAELAKKSIGVTLINPGGTWTDLWAGEDLPADRLLLTEDIAKLVVSTVSLSKQAVVEEIVVRPMLGDMHE